MLLGELQQLRGQHHEAARELEDDPQRRVDLAALDRADVVAVQPGREAQLLLAQAAPSARLTHRTTERPVLPPTARSFPLACLPPRVRAPRSARDDSSGQPAAADGYGISASKAHSFGARPGGVPAPPGPHCHWRQPTRPEPAADLKRLVEEAAHGMT